MWIIRILCKRIKCCKFISQSVSQSQGIVIVNQWGTCRFYPFTFIFDVPGSEHCHWRLHDLLFSQYCIKSLIVLVKESPSFHSPVLVTKCFALVTFTLQTKAFCGANKIHPIMSPINSLMFKAAVKPGSFTCLPTVIVPNVFLLLMSSQKRLDPVASKHV